MQQRTEAQLREAAVEGGGGIAAQEEGAREGEGGVPLIGGLPPLFLVYQVGGWEGGRVGGWEGGRGEGWGLG
jgi:hypothetical protein